MFLWSASLIATTLIGGLVPLFVGKSHRIQHGFVAIATGLFLGIVFLHLLPEALVPASGGLPTPWPGALVLTGVLALYVVENLVLPGDARNDSHVALGWSSFVGLSVHAFASGLGLAAVRHDPDVAGVLFLSIVAHKAAEGFSLSAVFRLSDQGTRRIVMLVALFALATPAGLVLGVKLLEFLTSTGAQAVTALAAGTFLYVSLGDLLPEVFHGREDRALRLALLVIGILASTALHTFGA